MSKGLTAIVLAATMALTSLTASRAHAGNEELGRFLLGAGALIIIGSALSNNRSSHEDRHRRHRVLPAHCMRYNETHHGPRRYFGKRCLSKNMENYSRLPGACRTKALTHRGWREVFGAHCLKTHGWVVS